jgi:hypothetical protein
VDLMVRMVMVGFISVRILVVVGRLSVIGIFLSERMDLFNYNKI